MKSDISSFIVEAKSKIQESLRAVVSNYNWNIMSYLMHSHQNRPVHKLN